MGLVRILVGDALENFSRNTDKTIHFKIEDYDRGFVRLRYLKICVYNKVIWLYLVIDAMIM